MFCFREGWAKRRPKHENYYFTDNWSRLPAWLRHTAKPERVEIEPDWDLSDIVEEVERNGYTLRRRVQVDPRAAE
ncbi:hypothetical protein [Pelagibacterium sp. H642]|uniref:hypothetical protein n=1 Tax=Pelagibacterium sp. H642 TaxID=1881069 RepID=UPI002814F005|nr:hypothetical protein [Pelagibacterium sp. H642]WMT92802.1 hypothetical protein NO934_18650 [Pelagibacterium sp. H642]